MGRAFGLLVLVPILMLSVPVILVLNLLGLNKSSAGPDYLEENIERFIAGADKPYDWDDFCSVPLKDAELDSIRARVCDFGPWNYADDSRETELRKLLDEVRAISIAKTIA
jgi:hypothetical protein